MWTGQVGRRPSVVRRLDALAGPFTPTADCGRVREPARHRPTSGRGPGGSHEGEQVNADGHDGSDVREEMLRCLDALYGYAMALTHNPTEAEDLVQDTYMQATLNCEKLRRDSNVKAWMFTIMRNRWLKQLRHAKNGPDFVALDDTSAERWMADTDHEPGHLCERIWEREEIRTALKQLPVRQREIILLRDIEGFSYREMAEMLDCPLGTIMSRLARARDRFRTLLVIRRHDDWSRTVSNRN